EYTRNISLLVPEIHWQTAGSLIAVISGQHADLQQFGSTKFLPEYDACNAQAKSTHVQALIAAKAGLYVPSRPEFDRVNQQIDMPAVLTLIAEAQVITEIPDTGITPVPGALILGINIDAVSLAAACGLSRVVPDEQI
ncbi:hypothetical protein WHK02_14575, partial [Staphylococcus aureus]|uniref:hypothetical protein n=1 Tax=Staphylococcus aureus TaxID=1280 RepID=UPI0039BE3F9D